MGQLTITFSGIMTHFYDRIPFDSIAPKIPMRSVLPDAMGINIGYVHREPSELADISPLLVGYYLMPHLPLISDTQTVILGTTNWIPLIGTHLEVANPAPASFAPPLPGEGYQLTEFVPGVRISLDVVQNENAAAYFDLFSGTASVVGRKDNPFSSLSTKVVVETVDTPRIKITPFSQSPLDLTKFSFLDANQEWSLPGGELYVTNLDVDSGEEDVPIEFLLNYLVAEGGLPKSIAKNMPGMLNHMTPLTLGELGQRLENLGIALKNAPLAALTREGLARAYFDNLKDNVALDQSCSDSRFP